MRCICTHLTDLCPAGARLKYYSSAIDDEVVSFEVTLLVVPHLDKGSGNRYLFG
jgi:hypothetical protein